MYLTILYKILYHSIRYIRVILSRIILSWMVQYLSSYLWFTMPAHSDSNDFYLVFLLKILYHFIQLIYAILTHMVLSRTVKYLMSYIKITTPAVRIVHFRKNSHGYGDNPQPATRIRQTRTHGCGYG